VSTELHDSFAPVLDELEPLAARTRNVFATPDFLSTWWDMLGAGRRLVVAASRDEEARLVAVAPLYVWRERPVRILRFVGHGVGDELGPIAEDPQAGVDAVGAALAATRAQVLLGEQLPTGWSGRLRARVLAREGNPVLRLADREWGRDWDAYLRTRSSNFRQRIRRMERRLTGDRGASFRLADDPARLPADLDTLFSLHSARWGTGTAFYRNRDLHRDLAPLLLEHGRLRLWLLETEDEPVAACYCFRYAGVDSFYNGGRSPAWDKDSVGLVILAHAARDALAAGQEEFRFLRGDEPYKYQFTDDDPGLETVGVARGALGSAALLAAVGARKLRR
jgi:CelD/BcsL family acetyltransferase involved in cellulose biosynthesis